MSVKIQFFQPQRDPETGTVLHDESSAPAQVRTGDRLVFTVPSRAIAGNLTRAVTDLGNALDCEVEVVVGEALVPELGTPIIPWSVGSIAPDMSDKE